MIRINLLPPEILAKRRFERLRVYVLIGGVAAMLVLGAVFAFGFVQVGVRSNEVQSLRAQAEGYRATAESYKIFEARKEDLKARQAISDVALADRVQWGRLEDELSLVLPSAMWLGRVSFSEDTGVEIEGMALDDGADVPDSGHKEIAKLLVRLADLDQLYDVWLTSSEKTEYEDKSALQWKVSCKVRKPSEEASATPSPAPPVQPVSQ